MTKSRAQIDIDTVVRERYSTAAQDTQTALCCPVEYDRQYLEVLPEELIERDYGCGDPSKYIRSGETVLDLGSGGGKICYIASQIVGAEGRVLGVDQNDEMLALARRFQDQVSERVGWRNTEFYKGQIQDLALDLERFETYLADHPVLSSRDWIRAERWMEEQRQTNPMICNDSIDVVVSNCVLNLVSPQSRQQLFAELFRVLKPGGRAVISDIVSDEPVPDHLQNDPTLWSGCISGAFMEHEFLQAFADAGFYGIEIVGRQQEAWAILEGIEFRSMTLQAYKGNAGPCLDLQQAVLYNGPWKSVTDDDGYVLRRGERLSVCGRSYKIYSRDPYQDQVTLIPPTKSVPEAEAGHLDCHNRQVRDPRVTKGDASSATVLPQRDCCGPESDCC
jgi:arsenite methyltransferase